MKFILQIIILFVFLLETLGTVLERRSDKKADGTTNVVCSYLSRLNKRVDKKILEFIKEVEDMRRQCICAFDKTVDQKLATMKQELTSIKNGCICAVEKCPDGWTKFQESCILLRTDRSAWSDAKEKCESLGSHLVEIDSIEKNQFLLDLISKNNLRGDFWIGASDTKSEGEWKWSNSGKPLDFDKWGVGEPNGGTRENCAHLYSTKGLTWNDYPCSWTSPYICEKITTM